MPATINFVGGTAFLSGETGATGAAGATGPSGVLTTATFTSNGSVKQTVYNVRDYLAVGDGVVDDRVAIQNTIDAAVTGNGICYLPEGTYLIGGTGLAKDTDNVTIVGAGRDKTILKNNTSSGSTVLNIGNSSGPTVRSNITVRGLTIDMDTKRCWGISTPWCKDVNLVNLKIKNPATNAYSMMYVGLFSNQSATWDAQNITIEDVIFDYGGVTSAWEALTLGFCRNVRVRRCQFLNKTGNIAALLNYNSEEVAITDCYFYRSKAQVGGRGPLVIDNCRFRSSWVLAWAQNNMTISNSAFFAEATDQAAGRTVGISFKGNYFGVGAGEAPFYIDVSTTPYSWNCTGNTIIGNHFSLGNSYAVYTHATTFSGTPVLDSDSLSIIGNTIDSNYAEAIHAFANYLVITGNKVKNSGQSGVAGQKENFFLGAVQGVFGNNQSYDDQSSPTVSRDVVFSNEQPSGFITTQNWATLNNSLAVNSGTFYYYNSGFTTTRPAPITVSSVGVGDVVGPASATDNALVRFDTTTGKLVQNSTATLGDTGGISSTIAAAGNAVALSLTQNDTTNNPRVIDITNAGTGIGQNIAQNGNGKALVISDAGTQRSLEINKNNTGPAIVVTRNQSNGISAMITFTQSNASDPQDAVQITNAGTGNSLKINTSDLLVKGGKTGIGNTPTAFLDSPAATTAAASFRIRSGTAPTSPNDGDMWYDGSHLQYRIGSTTYQIDNQGASTSFATLTKYK